VKRIIAITMIVATLASVILILFSKNSNGTIISVFTDHLREETYSMLLIEAGFKIFYEPMIDIARKFTVYHMYVTWPLVPFDRPIGCALLFLPFAYAEDVLKVSSVIVHKLEIIFLIILAGSGLYIIFDHLSDIKVSKIVIVILVLSLVPYVLFWAMNGIYDAAAILPVALSLYELKKGKVASSLVLLSLAMFLHYRAIIYAPLLLYLYLLVIGRGMEARGLTALTVSSSLVGVTAYTGYLTFIRFPYDDAIYRMMTSSNVLSNPLNVISPCYSILTPFIAVTIVALCVLYSFSMPRDFVLTTSCMMTYLMLIMFHPLYQFWYPILSIPLIMIPENPRSVETVSIWILTINIMILCWFILTLMRGPLLDYVQLFKNSISV